MQPWLLPLLGSSAQGLVGGGSDEQVFGTNGGGNISSGNSLKGNCYDMLQTRYVRKVGFIGLNLEPHRLLIAEVNTSGVVQSVLYDAGSVTPADASTEAVFDISSTPVVLASGTRYAVGIYRVDGLGTTFKRATSDPRDAYFDLPASPQLYLNRGGASHGVGDDLTSSGTFYMGWRITHTAD